MRFSPIYMYNVSMSVLFDCIVTSTQLLCSNEIKQWHIHLWNSMNGPAKTTHWLLLECVYKTLVHKWVTKLRLFINNIYGPFWLLKILLREALLSSKTHKFNRRRCYANYFDVRSNKHFTKRPLFWHIARRCPPTKTM